MQVQYCPLAPCWAGTAASLCLAAPKYHPADFPAEEKSCWLPVWLPVPLWCHLRVPALTGELVPAHGEGKGGPAPLARLLLGALQGGGTGTAASKSDPCEVFPWKSPLSLTTEISISES